MDKDQKRRKGIFLIGLSVFAFSTSGLFVKGLTADPWTIIFWRGVFAACLTTAYLAWTKSIRQEVFNLGYSGWAVVAMYLLGPPAFITAFKYTTVANVSLIYAAVPFMAAVLAWVCISERPQKSTLIASAAALLGVVIIINGSIGGSGLIGDLLALWMTLTLATIMVIYRRYPSTPAAGPSVVGTVLLLPISAVMGDPLGAVPSEIPYMAVFGLIFAFASITLSAGSRYLPAAEAGLISAMETPLGPLWVWLILAEVPTMETFMGGAIIMVAVIVNTLLQNRKTYSA